MNIAPTKKAGNIPLQAFIDQGWTVPLLIEHGYAREVLPEPIMAINGHGETPKPLKSGTAMPNVFGVTDLVEVTNRFKEFGGRPGRDMYPKGWTMEQQILYVADQLAREFLGAEAK